MQSRDNAPDDVPQHQCMLRTDCPSRGIRLTTLAGGALNQPHVNHVCQWDVGSGREAHLFMNMVTAEPTSWLGNQPVPDNFALANPSLLLLGHPEPHDYLYGFSTQSHFPQHPLNASDQLSEGSDGLVLASVGENPDPAIAVDYDDVSPGGIWSDSEDPGGFSRCDTDPRGPIHLTTNIRMARPQVSYSDLIKEVCRYSAWKTHWY